MKRAWLTWLFLVCLAPALSATTVQQARGMFLGGDREGARTLLDSLLTEASGLTESERSEASYLRALLEENGDLVERRLTRYLERAGKKTHEGAALLLMGRLAFGRGDFPAALESFDKAREKGRVEEGALWSGLSALALGQVETAREALTRAARSGNRRIRERAWVALGDLYNSGGQCDRALEWYGRVGEAGPDSPWWSTALLHEARCLRRLGQTEDADNRLTLLLSLRPDSYEAPFARNEMRGALSGPVPPPALDEPESSFGVQVGAFSVRANAGDLADRLRDAGFGSVRVNQSDDVHRVVVGRLGTRSEAEALGDSLMQWVGSGYRVVRLDTP